jgi:hypothetical protein
LVLAVVGRPDAITILYGLPGRSAFTHTAADPLPPHVTLELD